MDKLTDNYIEFHELFGTPGEKAQQYKDIVDSAYREERMMISKRWGRLMEVNPRYYSTETLGGVEFVLIHWEAMRWNSPEKYWEDEEVIE